MSEPLTAAQIAALESLALKATPGPWWIERAPNGKPYEMLGMFNGNLPDKIIDCQWGSATERGERDYAFIAAANPQTILALIQQLRDQRAALEDAAGTLQHLALHHPDCLGWVGHDKDHGPWPEIQERATAARKALSKPEAP